MNRIFVALFLAMSITTIPFSASASCDGLPTTECLPPPSCDGLPTTEVVSTSEQKVRVLRATIAHLRAKIKVSKSVADSR